MRRHWMLCAVWLAACGAQVQPVPDALPTTGDQVDCVSQRVASDDYLHFDACGYEQWALVELPHEFVGRDIAVGLELTGDSLPDALVPCDGRYAQVRDTLMTCDGTRLLAWTNAPLSSEVRRGTLTVREGRQVQHFLTTRTRAGYIRSLAYVVRVARSPRPLATMDAVAMCADGTARSRVNRVDAPPLGSHREEELCRPEFQAQIVLPEQQGRFRVGFEITGASLPDQMFTCPSSKPHTYRNMRFTCSDREIAIEAFNMFGWTPVPMTIAEDADRSCGRLDEPLTGVLTLDDGDSPRIHPLPWTLRCEVTPPRPRLRVDIR